MKTSIGMISRVMLLICALALAVVLFVPIWRIDLVAPQYPEGLYLLIYSNRLAGNVEVINGLNHYIGMKTLHSADFFEFTLLPFLIGFFALLFLLAALAGKRWLLNLVFTLFVLFGIAAMVDFWRWEYNYGHNLDPDAAIKVPGMSYEPPLIGYKQLLNFSAYSMPALGGWLFVGAGLLALAAVVLEWKRKWQPRTVLMLLGLLALLGLGSCSAAPERIRVGTDNCNFCKMTVSDARFGAEIVTAKGKLFKFDDAHCLLKYLQANWEKDAKVYFVAFDGNHPLLNVKDALLFRSAELNTPMGGNIAALSNRESLREFAARFNGSEISWEQLQQP